MEKTPINIVNYFSDMPDPRMDRRKSASCAYVTGKQTPLLRSGCKKPTIIFFPRCDLRHTVVRKNKTNLD